MRRRMHLGATPFSLYNTYTAEQIQYQVSDAEARIVVTEQAFEDRVRALTGVEHVIVVDAGRRRAARRLRASTSRPPGAP